MKFAEGNWADSLFFTSPELRKVIREHPRWKKMEKIGSIGFSLLGEKIEQQTYPFSELKKEGKVLIGKGIGSGLEEKVLSHLERRVGNVVVEPSFGMAGEKRVNQLKRRNVRHKADSFNPYSIKLRRMLDAIKMVKRRRKRVTQQLRRR